LADGKELCPQLSVDNPLVATFLGELQNYVLSQADNVTKIPIRVPRSITWPILGSDVDEYWEGENGVENHEPNVPYRPAWLNMGRERLVKPRGSFSSPILVFSRCITPILLRHALMLTIYSYASMMTIHRDCATVDDLSNGCMADVFHKMGFFGPEMRAADMLYIDMFPRRLDRKNRGMGSWPSMFD
jgi:hypothetical protein